MSSLDASLTKIDLTEQSVLIAQVLGCEVQLATCSATGSLLATTATDARVFNDQYRTALGKLCGSLALTDQELNLDNSCGIAGAPIIDVDNGERGWVCVVYEHDGGIDRYLRNTARHLCALLASHLRSYYRAENELDAFATELAERYDELNLVYDADRAIESYHLESEVLSSLLEHCTAHLQIDVALLYAPEKSIELSADIDILEKPALEELSGLADTLLSMVTYNKLAIVLNTPEERAALPDNVTRKIMAAPIEAARGTIEGVLCVAKSSEADDFTNSDRNLLEVMSRRVTQVLQSSHDELTGIFNRTSFEKHIEQCIANNRVKRSEHCLLNVDIDDFHVVNETYGFGYGDEIIRLVAQLVESRIRDDDIVARIGANEFGILLRHCPGDAGEAMAGKLCDAIREIELPDPNKPLDLSVSIGMSLLGSPLDITGDVISRAELACQEAKARGKNTVFNPHAEQGTIEERRKQVSWISVINAALARDEFRLYAQSIQRIESRSDEIHFEILLRLRKEDGTVLSPFAFIPAAERYRLMPKVDRWVLRQTCAFLDANRQALSTKSVKAAVNLSGQSLSQDGFADFVVETVGGFDIPPTWLCLEVTESAAIANIERAQGIMDELAAHGFCFALDDFGTGLSSFEYLKSLKVEYLKIDGFFIKQILEDPVSAAIVGAMCQVAKSMGLETIAEFVTDPAIQSRIADLGVDFAQGYSIDKPMPLPEYLASKT